MTLKWFEFAFKIKGSVAPIILPRVLVFTGFAVAVSIFHHYEPQVSLKVLGDLTNNNAKRIFEAIAELESGGGTMRELIE